MDFTDVEERTYQALNGSADHVSLLILPLLSHAQYATVILYAFSIAIPVCTFGIFSNILNIFVFYKMGLSTPSFVWPSQTWSHCCMYYLQQLETYLDISMLDVSRIGALAYHSVSAMSSWITAVINVERSCCVAFPMKVRKENYNQNQLLAQCTVMVAREL